MENEEKSVHNVVARSANRKRVFEKRLKNKPRVKDRTQKCDVTFHYVRVDRKQHSPHIMLL